MMDGLLLWTTIFCGLLVFVHLLAARFHPVVGSPRRRRYSVLAGITIGYLFLMLLPKLRQPELELGGWPFLDAAGETLLFGVALVGFVLYYALEAWARSDLRPNRRGDQPTERHIFRVHLGAFAVYSAIVAFLFPYYLQVGPGATLTYLIAIALHLLVLDHALAEMHGGRYGWRARAVLSGGVAAGWLLTVLAGPPYEAAVTEVLHSFLAGAMALNVIKEEVPAEKSGHPLAFALGVLLFQVMLTGGRILDRIM